MTELLDFYSIMVIGVFFTLIIIGFISIILFGNKEKWYRYRKIPFKKLLIDVPNDCKIFIVSKLSETIELNILGKKRTYLLPKNGSKDGTVYHFWFEDPNPLVIPDSIKWQPNKSDKQKMLPQFEGKLSSEQVTTLINNQAFRRYLTSKISQPQSLLIILVVVSIAIAGFAVYQISELKEFIAPILSESVPNGG